MDATAIKQIQESANIPQLMLGVAAATNNPVALLPPGYSIADMEEHNEFASHFKLDYKTTAIPDYLEYCKSYAAPGSGCFIDAETMSAKAVFDIGSPEEPGHKFHTATLKLQQTAAYKAFLRVQDKRLSQREAAEFVEDWADIISTVQSDGGEGSAKEAAKGLRAITIDMKGSVATKVGDMGQQMTAMEKIEANNAGTIPSTIIVCCPPYQGLVERYLHLRVQITFPEPHRNEAMPAGPVITLRFVGQEEVEEQLAEEMKRLVMAGLDGTDIKARIGTIT